MLNRISRKLRISLKEDFRETSIFFKHSQIYHLVQAQLPLIYIVMSYFAFLQVWHRVYLDGVGSPGPFFFLKYYSNEIYIFFRWIPAPLLLMAAYFPKNKMISVVALFSFIHQGALVNALGVSENQYRPAIWLACCLLFLPISSAPKNRLERQKFISHYHFSLMIFSFAYAVSGFWKVAWGGIYQLFFDNFGFWNYKSMTYIITEYTLRTHYMIPSALWVAGKPFLGWFLIWGGIFIEATVWIVLFRPSLWRIYGALIVLLHMGSKLTMNIGFEAQYLFVGLLFFLSPFQRDASFLEVLKELPVFKFIRKSLLKI